MLGDDIKTKISTSLSVDLIPEICSELKIMAQDSNKSIQKYVNDVLEAHIRKDMDEEGLNDITKDNPSRASDCLKAFDVEW